MQQAKHKSATLFLVPPFPLLSMKGIGMGKKKGLVPALVLRTCLPSCLVSCERQMLFAWVSFWPSWVTGVMPVEEGSSWNALGDSKQPKIKRIGI